MDNNKTALLYDVVLSGDLLHGYSEEQVRNRLSAAFGLTHRRSEQLIKHKQFIYAKELTFEQADAYIEKFKKAGLGAFCIRHVPEKDQVSHARRDTPTIARGKQLSSETLAKVDKNLGRSQQLKHKYFQFTGQGAEYFRIWIVNVVLTILTLGIYSAWAKVRNKQYFYGNTILDDASFSYRAEPKQILKGRLIAFAFFIGYYALSTVYPLVEPVFGFVFLLLFPWLMVKSMAFNAHYSEYRNVRFGFDGKYGDALTVFIAWPLLSLFTLGLLFPYAVYQQQRYLVTNHRYGDTRFTFEATSGAYYRIFLMLIGISLLMGVLVGVVTAAAQSDGRTILAAIIGMMMYLLLFVFYNVKITNLRFNSAMLAGNQFESALQVPQYYAIVLTNTLATVLTLGLFLPWAKVRIAQYKAENISVLAQGDLDTFSADMEQRVGSLGEGIGDVFDLDLGF